MCESGARFLLEELSHQCVRLNDKIREKRNKSRPVRNIQTSVCRIFLVNKSRNILEILGGEPRVLSAGRWSGVMPVMRRPRRCVRRAAGKVRVRRRPYG